VSTDVTVTGEVGQRKYRHSIPREHRVTLDTRLAWLWNQRFGTVQTIWLESDDLHDKLAATIMLQAVVASDLNNIALVFRRLEGGALPDEVTLDGVLTL
jgi:hypothetical protein